MSGSGSGAWLALRFFFIILTFLFRRTAGADDPNGPRALGKTDQQESVLSRMADDDFAVLLLRVDLIVENRRERVRKNGSCFLEGYAVFLLIGSRFVLVPLESKAHRPSPSSGVTDLEEKELGIFLCPIHQQRFLTP